MSKLKTLLIMIFVGLLLGFLNSSCGTDEQIDQIYIVDQAVLENQEPETLTMLMCQVDAESCDSDGVCVEDTKPVEFEIDQSLIYWQACYNFRPCDEETKNVYTEEQIQDYAENFCN